MLLLFLPGPLLYHYADMPMEMSIELSYEEVRKVIEQTGFIFEVSKYSAPKWLTRLILYLRCVNIVHQSDWPDWF